MTEVRSPHTSNKPCYRYLRPSDRLPTHGELGEDPVLKVRLFNPTGAGTWWVAAYDPETEVAYGVAEIQELEAGSFSMAELVAFRGRWGLPIERDLHYAPVRMSELLRRVDPLAGLAELDASMARAADAFQVARVLVNVVVGGAR